MRLTGKSIVPGEIRAKSIVSESPISFLGDIDPQTGRVVDKDNMLYGQLIKDKIFVFPCGKGSTVGSYIIYQLFKNKKAPAAIINVKAEAIVAVGAIISGIPMMSEVEIEMIPPDVELYLNAKEGFIEF